MRPRGRAGNRRARQLRRFGLEPGFDSPSTPIVGAQDRIGDALPGFDSKGRLQGSVGDEADRAKIHLSSPFEDLFIVSKTVGWEPTAREQPECPFMCGVEL